MNRWIFVIKGSDEEFQSRVKTKKWPIFNKTQNRKKLAIGDFIVFYKAGINGQRFLGSATIKTELKEQTTFKYFLEMDKISVWKNPVAMKQIIAKLDFVKNKNSWGNYFQGGVRAVSEKDFFIITNQNLTKSL